jgi:hypothetical protein
LRLRVNEANLVCVGSLQVRKKRCGRKSCKCRTEAVHGTVNDWTRLIDKKLTHELLTDEQAALVREAIANYREIQRLLKLWAEQCAYDILELEADDDE